ncbi:MAG: NADP-dependent oxidoreductase [Agriterribacter sp.]
MKAIRMHDFGGPEVLMLEEVTKPVPAADEVLVKVIAAGVNPVDWKIRKGLRKDKFPVSLPLIPGWDVSGIVEATGSEVDYFKQGDKVFGRPDPTRNGAYAEYITVKANQLYFKPETIEHVEAAAVPLAGLTAWQGLFDHGQLTEGQRVLIHAASGGVGSWAVQFAKWKGAYVYATTSEKNRPLVKQLGADEVIDYKNERFEDQMSAIDLVLDTVGGYTQYRSLQVLRPAGRLVTTLAPEYDKEARARNVSLISFLTDSLPTELREIGEIIDAGQAKPVISRVFRLNEAADAQRLSETGHARGKIVLSVVPPDNDNESDMAH